MKLRYAVIATLLGSSFLSSAQAALFDFSFTFSNQSSGHLGGTVTGIVRGLTDNATSAASSVEITSNSNGFGLGEYVGNPANNSWAMSGGLVTHYSFISFGVDNGTCCTLGIDDDAVFGFIALFNNPSGGVYSGTPSISFTRLQTTVPEPDVSWLLGAAAVGIGASVRKSRRAGARVSRT